MNDTELKAVLWHGDSLKIVRSFALSVRQKLGHELFLLQLGEKPLHCRPMDSVGRGVWEIRINDRGGAFRAFFVVWSRDGIHVLHAFVKKTRKTSRKDLAIGRSRFSALQRTHEEKEP